MNSTDIPKWDPNVLTPQDLKWLIPQGIAFGAWIRPYIKAVSIVT